MGMYRAKVFITIGFFGKLIALVDASNPYAVRSSSPASLDGTDTVIGLPDFFQRGLNRSPDYYGPPPVREGTPMEFPSASGDALEICPSSDLPSIAFQSTPPLNFRETDRKKPRRWWRFFCICGD
jgi:hypothetical protein